MLTLIVVVAAGSFAVFVAQKQQAVQDQELYQLHQQQELLVIDDLITRPASNATLSDLNFTVSSNHQLESKITRINVNGHVLRDWLTYRLNVTSGAWESRLVQWNDSFVIEPKEQLFIDVNASDFFETGLNYPATGLVKLEINTGYQNSFSRAFMPPTAVLSMKTEALWSGTSFNNYLVLDASASAAQDESSLVSYEWTVTNKASGLNQTLGGVMTTVQFPSAGDYWINLTVTDNHGLLAMDSLSYTHA